MGTPNTLRGAQPGSSPLQPCYHRAEDPTESRNKGWEPECVMSGPNGQKSQGFTKQPLQPALNQEASSAMGSPCDWWLEKPGGQSQLYLGGQSQLYPGTPQTGNWILILSLAKEEQKKQYTLRDVSANTFKTNYHVSPLHNNIQELQKWEKPLSEHIICITAGATHAGQLYLDSTALKFPKLAGNLSW